MFGYIAVLLNCIVHIGIRALTSAFVYFNRTRTTASASVQEENSREERRKSQSGFSPRLEKVSDDSLLINYPDHTACPIYPYPLYLRFTAKYWK